MNTIYITYTRFLSFLFAVRPASQCRYHTYILISFLFDDTHKSKPFPPPPPKLSEDIIDDHRSFFLFHHPPPAYLPNFREILNLILYIFHHITSTICIFTITLFESIFDWCLSVIVLDK